MFWCGVLGCFFFFGFCWGEGWVSSIFFVFFINFFICLVLKVFLAPHKEKTIPDLTALPCLTIRCTYVLGMFG
ncbi:hypothetical protein CSC81_16535 [Tenacibaculum discolor]|uniref:Uncharacterized protein n=1 Tax=Tenacibaculum discolor TaxID=361581 RepID=A0A2G1BQF8_9FLAO|nr:hypothetical protein CSC81_16535 [Tenacibaculum discolor]